MAINEEVTLYSTGCPKCTVLEKKLDSKGVKYKKVDSVDELRDLGILEVPVIKIGDTIMNFTESVAWVNKM